MAKPKVVGTGPPKEPILYERRVSYAKRRIMSVLRYWVLAYRRELERQVCEVGFDYANAPAHQRTEPHHFSEAITVLVDEGKIEPFSIQIGNKPFQFWANSAAGEAARKAVFERKERALRVFEAVAAQPPLLGWHAESIYHKALLAAEEVWSSVGWKGGVKQYTLGRYALTFREISTSQAITG